VRFMSSELGYCKNKNIKINDQQFCLFSTSKNICLIKGVLLFVCF